MAPTKKTKAERIREYLSEHPDATCPEVSKGIRTLVHSSEFTAARKKLGLPLGTRPVTDRVPKTRRKRSRVIVPGSPAVEPAVPHRLKNTPVVSETNGTYDMPPNRLAMLQPPASRFELLERLEELAQRAPGGLLGLRKLLDILEEVHEVEAE